MYDLKDQTFGRLKVLKRDPLSGGKGEQVWWECSCECGKRVSVRSYNLRIGDTRSCGCLRTFKVDNKLAEKHGQHNTTTYHTWEGMKQRCLNPNATRYPDYGAVGVTVCDKWLVFEGFYEDMGDRPKGLTLDRINPFGNYCKDNCRWETKKVQANNTRRKYISEGVTLPC